MLNKHKSIIFFCVFRFLRKDVNMQKNADSASAYYAPFRRGVMSCSIRKSQSPKKVPSLEAFLLEDLILLLKPKTVLFSASSRTLKKTPISNHRESRIPVETALTCTTDWTGKLNLSTALQSNGHGKQGEQHRQLPNFIAQGNVLFETNMFMVACFPSDKLNLTCWRVTSNHHNYLSC